MRLNFDWGVVCSLMSVLPVQFASFESFNFSQLLFIQDHLFRRIHSVGILIPSFLIFRQRVVLFMPSSWAVASLFHLFRFKAS